MSLLIIGPLPNIQIGSITLPTYHVFMSLLLSGLAYFIYWRADKKQMSGTTALDLFLFAVLGGTVGARVFHIIYEEPAYYWQSPWKVFYFWEGGFVYFAGLLAGLLAGYMTVKIKRESFTLWADFCAPVISLGYALGRIACFLEGCCYGKVCDLPWAYRFGELNLSTNEFLYSSRHPTQLYAFAMELLIFFFILHLEKMKKFSSRPGSLFMFWLLLHALGRIVMEAFRDDDRGFFIFGLSVSTVISLFLVATSALYFSRKPK
jgi:phosphatidylglycerol---prolipoprotein diacylglyceryl transferase